MTALTTTVALLAGLLADTTARSLLFAWPGPGTPSHSMFHFGPTFPADQWTLCF